MKLRQAKKILRNCRDDKCSYSPSTLHRASKKFRPYLLKECERKNVELRENGIEHIVYAPYYVKEKTFTKSEMKEMQRRRLETRYVEVGANTVTSGYIQWANLINNQL